MCIFLWLGPGKLQILHLYDAKRHGSSRFVRTKTMKYAHPSWCCAAVWDLSVPPPSLECPKALLGAPKHTRALVVPVEIPGVRAAELPTRHILMCLYTITQHHVFLTFIVHSSLLKHDQGHVSLLYLIELGR